MRKAKDYKSSYRARWITNNPESLLVTKSELFKSEWDRVAYEVGENKRAVVLMKNRDMIGTIIPAEFLYEFQSTMPHLIGVDPIIDVIENDFKKNFDEYFAKLGNGISLIILDNDNNPKFAVASRGFSVDITTDNEGIAKFRGDIAQYMFSDKGIDPNDIEQCKDIDDLVI